MRGNGRVVEVTEEKLERSLVHTRLNLEGLNTVERKIHAKEEVVELSRSRKRCSWSCAQASMEL